MLGRSLGLDPVEREAQECLGIERPAPFGSPRSHGLPQWLHSHELSFFAWKEALSGSVDIRLSDRQLTPSSDFLPSHSKVGDGPFRPLSDPLNKKFMERQLGQLNPGCFLNEP